MERQLVRTATVTLVVCMAIVYEGAAQTQVDTPAPLVVEAARPLHIALDARVRIQDVGQPVTGTVIEPVYVRDRIVIPAGTRATGHVVRFEGVPRRAKVAAVLNGDFSPMRQPIVEFNRLLVGGRPVPIQTRVTGVTPNLRRVVAAASDRPDDPGAAGRAREAMRQAEDDVKHKVRDVVAAVGQPGRMGRLRDALVNRLPYHPQFIPHGTVYTAALVEPVRFAPAGAIERAVPGTMPAPSSILTARLLTPLDSKTTPRGARVAAVLSEPVFSSDRKVILPEGTRLEGSVTFVRGARHFQRNGNLRFLFDNVVVPGEESTTMLASLYSVQSAASARVAIDEEGGAMATSPKARFVMPALAVASFTTVADPREGIEVDEGLGSALNRAGSDGFAGYLGLGAVGVALSFASRPAGVALGLVGTSRAVYGAVFGRGREVSFPEDTVLQLQLSPSPPPRE